MRANRRQQALTYGVLTIFLLVAVMPFVGNILTSFKAKTELSRGLFTLPEQWRTQNYVNAWEGARFNEFFVNSVIVVVPVVLIAVVCSLLSGYAFGLISFRGERLLLLLIVLGLMAPTEAVIIPLWHLMDRLGLRDSYWALILPQIGLSFSFGTFWMRAHFKNMPRDLIDAAVVDGCNTSPFSPRNVLWKILLPLSGPALMSLVVLIFMWTWNEFFLVLVVGGTDYRTLPVGLALLRGRYSADVPVMAAASTIVSLPVILIYLLFQRSFIRGMISGAVKA